MNDSILALKALYHHARCNVNVDEEFLKTQLKTIESSLAALDIERLANDQLSEYAENWNDLLELEETIESFLLTFHEKPFGKPISCINVKELLGYIKNIKED